MGGAGRGAGSGGGVGGGVGGAGRGAGRGAGSGRGVGCGAVFLMKKTTEDAIHFFAIGFVIAWFIIQLIKPF